MNVTRCRAHGVMPSAGGGLAEPTRVDKSSVQCHTLVAQIDLAQSKYFRVIEADVTVSLYCVLPHGR